MLPWLLDRIAGWRYRGGHADELRSATRVLHAIDGAVRQTLKPDDECLGTLRIDANNLVIPVERPGHVVVDDLLQGLPHMAAACGRLSTIHPAMGGPRATVTPMVIAFFLYSWHTKKKA